MPSINLIQLANRLKEVYVPKSMITKGLVILLKWLIAELPKMGERIPNEEALLEWLQTGFQQRARAYRVGERKRDWVVGVIVDLLR